MINYSCSSNNINENKSYVESFIYRYDLQVNDSFIGIINYQTIGDYIKEAKKLNQTQKEALFKGIIEIPIEQSNIYALCINMLNPSTISLIYYIESTDLESIMLVNYSKRNNHIIGYTNALPLSFETLLCEFNDTTIYSNEKMCYDISGDSIFVITKYLEIIETPTGDTIAYSENTIRSYEVLKNGTFDSHIKERICEGEKYVLE